MNETLTTGGVIDTATDAAAPVADEGKIKVLSVRQLMWIRFKRNRLAVIGAAWGLRRHQQYAVFPAAISVVLFVIAVALFFLDWWRGLSFSFK